MTSVAGPALLTLAALMLLGDGPAGKPADICGWFDNPTPGNASLFDGRREWVLAQQGGPEASGDWPHFTAAQRVSHGHGSYGYGCACLAVYVDDGAVTAIASAEAKPLNFCRGQQKLRHAERKLR